MQVIVSIYLRNSNYLNYVSNTSQIHTITRIGLNNVNLNTQPMQVMRVFESSQVET